MVTLRNGGMEFALTDDGMVGSFYNRRTCREYVYTPGPLWKMIVRQGERTEIPVFSRGQRFEVSARGESRAELCYRGLACEGRTLGVEFRLLFEMDGMGLSVSAEITNNDDLEVMELGVTAASGIRSLSGDPARDAIAWPNDLGRRLADPAESDLSKFMGFRKYERHDQFHTDMDLLYPGPASMQWFDLYNDGEGLYVASHDTSHQTVCLHAERDVKSGTLSLGIIRYPFLKKGEAWKSAPVVYAAHAGDWHAGAGMYRAWMEQTGWKAPENPAWVKDFTGWLRVILKQHHCEINWDYSRIPALFDEVQAAGMNTIFLLGWERGGFARLWPDYVADDRMGGEAGLRKAIEYVHAKGGKVLMFLSYVLIDHDSEYYKTGGGGKVVMKSLWGQEIPFSETYCGEGTWRKIANPAMPMYLACPSAPEWQRKMAESAGYILDLGADGVLYDIGGITPFFCFDKSHPHEKPSMAFATKDANYAGLRESIKARSADNAILMEHNVDIFARHMDISQGASTVPAPNHLLEMYRYTFPEAVMTNRECGEDEEDYRAKANYSFIYGLRFDMTIFRCCGTLSDIPDYAAYLKEINALRGRHAKHLLEGRFVDNEGFAVDNAAIRAKAYIADDGSLAVAAWNTSAAGESFTVAHRDGRIIPAALGADSVGVYVFEGA